MPQQDVALPTRPLRTLLAVTRAPGRALAIAKASMRWIRANLGKLRPSQVGTVGIARCDNKWPVGIQHGAEQWILCAVVHSTTPRNHCTPKATPEQAEAVAAKPVGTRD